MTDRPSAIGSVANDRLVLQIIPGICLAAVFFHLGYEAAGAPGAGHGIAVLLGLCSYALGFASAAGAFATQGWWPTRVLPGLCFVAFVLWLGIGHLTSTSVVSPQFERYQSDSLAFDAYSAQLVIQGKDPYATSMAPSAATFNEPPPVYTPKVDGGRVSIEPYPALSFLVYVPFVAAHVQSMIWVDIGFALAGMLLVLLLVPERTRIFFGLFFLLIPEFRDFAVGSGTDVVWLPFMIGVAATWDRRPAWCAVLLGLACAIKQEPWFIIPFALIHWWATSEPGRAPATTLKNLALLAVAFLAPNLPFVLWHPGPWLAGVLSPLLAHAVPLGSGLVQLQTGGLITLPLAIYTVLWAGALLACLFAYAKWPQRLAWLPFIAPAFVLFFSPRSLQNYFIYWPLVLAVYAATANLQRETSARAVSLRVLKPAAALGAVAVAIGIGFVGAAAAGGPVTMDVHRVDVDRDTGYIDRVVIELRNPTAHAQTFHFALSSPLNAMVFWHADRPEVPAHSRRTIELSPGDVAGELPRSPGVGLQVVAFAPRDEIAVYTRPLPQFADDPHPLRNGHLIAAVNLFQMLPVPAPLAWTAPPQPFLDGRLSMVHDGRFGRALAFRLTAPQTAEWSTVRVSQSFTMAGSHFTFWLKPAQSDDAPASSSHVFAVAFTDARGHQTFFAVNASVKRPTRVSRDRDTYVQLPGRIGSWNRYTVDFTGSTSGSTSVAIVAAVRRGYRGTAGGEFGGILEN